MSEARAIEIRIARLMRIASDYDRLNLHDAAYLIRRRARLWVRTAKVAHA